MGNEEYFNIYGDLLISYRGESETAAIPDSPRTLIKLYKN